MQNSEKSSSETVWKIRISSLLGSRECSKPGQEALIRGLGCHKYTLLSLLAIFQTVSPGTWVNKGKEKGRGVAASDLHTLVPSSSGLLRASCFGTPVALVYY
jgi:hypothetical protein